MKQVQTDLDYDILVGDGLLDKFDLQGLENYSKVVLITDENVAELYSEKLTDRLDIHLLVVPAGEKSKSRQQKAAIEDAMMEVGCKRDTLVLALGGGVVGDLAGFVAATYMRGLPFIQMPTTFLAMVDSSVGGKTAINTSFGKNLIGAFWPPSLVIADTSTLKTLSKEQLQAGKIEAVKMFLTHDAEALQLAHNDYPTIIERAIQIKAAVVAEDEREQGERALLNFGHTVGHALEKLSDFELLHGYAVGLGILVEAKMAQLEGHLDETSYATVEGLMESLGINPADIKKYDPAEIEAAMKLDKKAKGKTIKYVVLTGLGEVLRTEEGCTHPVQSDMLKQALNYFN